MLRQPRKLPGAFPPRPAHSEVGILSPRLCTPFPKARHLARPAHKLILPQAPASPASTQFLEFSSPFRPQTVYSPSIPQMAKKHVSLFMSAPESPYLMCLPQPCHQDHRQAHPREPRGQVLYEHTVGTCQVGPLGPRLHPSQSVLRHTTLWTCLQPGHFPSLAKMSTQVGGGTFVPGTEQEFKHLLVHF